MKNKGFTLIELLGVILILSILIIIVFPNIINLVKNTNDNIDSTSEKLIFNATELYIKDNKDYYKIGGKYCINITDLVQEDYIKSPIQYKDSPDITENKSVLVSYKNNENIYKLIDKTICKDGIAEINSKLGSDETNIFIDEDGNVRYRGKTPDNYVTFNNELWRIIGYIDGYIKLIRSESIGNIGWDSTNSNDWTRPASLMTYLNPSKVSGIEMDGEYWTNLSLESRTMIEKTMLHVGGLNSNAITSLAAYTEEREDIKTWEGYIGLMYPSDYGYASSDECSSTKNLSTYNDTTCKETNWLHIGINEWLQSPYSSNSTCVWYVYSDGNVAEYSDGTVNPIAVRPVVNLKSTIKFIGGDGSSDNPYKLAL